LRLQLELLDPQTGELRRLWPQIRSVRSLTFHGDFAAAATIDDILWLVELSR